MTGRGLGGPGGPGYNGVAEKTPEKASATGVPGARRPRRVSVTLDGEIYVAFRTFVVENGLTGEQALRMAVVRLIEEGPR